MKVNPKKPVTFINRTHYFDPGRTRVKNTFVSPNSYKFRQSKIEGYETRLYWQFRYCQDHDGQAFFYTLTYNDKNVPKYFGKNVFDYQDLRSILHGAFYQQLKRLYGTQLKFFVGAELGDGAGKRGLHNNPHYHIIFFLTPASAGKDGVLPVYKKITPVDFRKLIRLYWQGFDQDEGFQDFRDAKFGIAKEGLNCGLITDFRACMYVAKYVVKDVQLLKLEKNIQRYFTQKFGDEFLAQDKVREFRNRYSNKVRISNGVGLYAIEHIDDLNKPTIQVPTKDGFKNRPLSLYYYRKIYCDTVYDRNTKNTRYVLNDKGLQYKIESMKIQLKSTSVRACLNLKQLLQDESLYNKILHSDVNLTTFFTYPYSAFVDELTALLKHIPLYLISSDYAKFKLIYANRFFRHGRSRQVGSSYFPVLDWISDYSRFISPVKTHFESTPVRDFLKVDSKIYLPYYAHPYFLPYCRIFAVLDNFSDYFFVKDDDHKQKVAEEIANKRRFFKKLEVKDYFNSLVFV